MSLRSDDFDSVGEFYTEHEFRQLVVTIEATPAVKAGVKLHQLAGAKLHHGGVGASWFGICGTDGG